MVFLLLFLLNFSFGVYIGIELGQPKETGFFPVTLSMVYSSEKKSWINSIIDEFFFYMLARGVFVTMDFEPMGSRSMVISTITGEIKPTIISPASSIWLDYTNVKLALLERTPLIDPELTEKIIYSPIVIGTWKFFNLNETWNITGFDSLLNIPILRWSHTDPQLSNSGTMSVIMQVAAFLGLNTSDIKLLRDFANPEMLLKMAIIESKIPYYGASTGFLAKKALDGSLDVFIVYENLIIDMNKKDLAIVRGGAMAVYPEDGVLLADHPFCILKGDWVNPLELLVAEEFLKFIKSHEIVLKAIKKGFRPIDESILNDPVFNDTFNSVFTEFAGVQLEIPCPIYSSQIGSDIFDSYAILEEIPELWTIVRAEG
ncbi:MAG: substrate-binding domain-containing protein [Candidatus Helarchaeota archaeon]|nr:substrate-binding domain-containing protein [Candidatus Helarchaeota archaeon]